jgi:hypothetical protein
MKIHVQLEIVAMNYHTAKALAMMEEGDEQVFSADFGVQLRKCYDMPFVPKNGDSLVVDSLSVLGALKLHVVDTTYSIVDDAWLVECQVSNMVLPYDYYITVTERLEDWLVLRLDNHELGASALENRWAVDATGFSHSGFKTKFEFHEVY